MKNCDTSDCLSLPLREACFDFCVEKILRVATPVEKISILGMDEDLANAIFTAYNYGKVPISSFSDLERVLNQNQISQIRTIFKNLTQNQLDHFVPKL